MYIHRGAKRAIRSRAAAWSLAFADPGVDEEKLRAGATIWARHEIDDVFDIAVERPLGPSIAQSSFAVSTVLVAVAWFTYAKGQGNLLSVVFFGVVLLGGMIALQLVLATPSSRKLRRELADRLIAEALHGVQRRRAFITGTGSRHKRSRLAGGRAASHSVAASLGRN